MGGKRKRWALRLLTRAVLVVLALQVPASLGAAEPSRRQRDAARASLHELRDELSRAVGRYGELGDRIESIHAAMARTELGIRKLARKMLALEKSAVAVARDIYKGGSTIGLQGLLGARSVSDADNRLKYLETSGEAQATVFERLAVDRTSLETKLDDLDAARAASRAALAEMKRLQTGIERRIRAKEDELAAIDAALARAARAAAQQDVEKVAEKVVEVVEPPAPLRVPDRVDWDAIAMCESGGNWHLDSTYDGGLQIHPMTWLGYGGARYARYAWQATREEQIDIAERILAGQGPGAWPTCFKYGV